MKKPTYALSVKPFTPKEGSRGVVINAVSKVDRRDGSRRNIARVDVYLDGRPYKSLDAEDGFIRARRIALRRKGRKKAELLLEARDRANNLLAVCRRAI